MALDEFTLAAAAAAGILAAGNTCLITMLPAAVGVFGRSSLSRRARLAGGLGFWLSAGVSLALVAGLFGRAGQVFHGWRWFEWAMGLAYLVIGLWLLGPPWPVRVIGFAHRASHAPTLAFPSAETSEKPAARFWAGAGLGLAFALSPSPYLSPFWLAALALMAGTGAPAMALWVGLAYGLSHAAPIVLTAWASSLSAGAARRWGLEPLGRRLLGLALIGFAAWTFFNASRGAHTHF